MDHPTFCRIEYWNPVLAEWVVGHAGINLINPAEYVRKLGLRGNIARVVEVDTEEIAYGPGADLL